MINSRYKTEYKLIQFIIVIFWTLFWFLNVIDKFIGGSIPFWVGEDRLAQFIKFFYSIGITDLWVSHFFLIFTTLFEITAFIFLAFALWHHIRGNRSKSEFLFSLGTFVGLLLFTFFAIGDQIFGDRFELFEHTFFLIALLISWVIYIHFPKESKHNTFGFKFFKDLFIKYVAPLAVLGTLLILAVTPTVFIPSDFDDSRVDVLIIEPIHIGEGVYKFRLPFESTRTTWEETLTTFIAENKNLRILEIQTIPKELNSQADNVIMLIITEERELN